MPGHACPGTEKHATGPTEAQTGCSKHSADVEIEVILPWSHSSLQALVKKDSGLPGSKWCCKDCVQHKDHADSLG